MNKAVKCFICSDSVCEREVCRMKRYKILTCSECPAKSVCNTEPRNAYCEITKSNIEALVNERRS